jgi:hypothetical protein
MKDPIKGDKVYHYGRKAVVVSIFYNHKHKRCCEIEYLDNQVPFYEEVLAETLVVVEDSDQPPPFKVSKKKHWINSDKNCPICETIWTVTRFGNKTWYDCKPCKKTKEQIDKED